MRRIEHHNDFHLVADHGSMGARSVVDMIDRFSWILLSQLLPNKYNTISLARYALTIIILWNDVFLLFFGFFSGSGTTFTYLRIFVFFIFFRRYLNLQERA